MVKNNDGFKQRLTRLMKMNLSFLFSKVFSLFIMGLPSTRKPDFVPSAQKPFKTTSPSHHKVIRLKVTS